MDHSNPPSSSSSAQVPDLEGSYEPLLDQPQSQQQNQNLNQTQPSIVINPWKPIKGLLYTLSVIMFISMVIVLVRDQRSENHQSVLQNPSSDSSSSSSPQAVVYRPAESRGVSQGVSEKKFRLSSSDDGIEYPWTNNMLSWQRTAYHFQPEKNWMNDPNGPVYYNGWYHLFYQYNPEGAVWGNIVWGHAVSKDLTHWLHLPIAMVMDEWYDSNGVWTGSATILPDGSLVMLYTGSTNESVQVQNVAYPADPSDPLLINWVKSPKNPVLVPPPGIDLKDFRDPTTAWLAPNGKWRVTIGSKINKTGISMVYETSDFLSYTLLDGLLHEVPGTGMWECVDFFPVSTTAENGLDTSVNGPGIKHVLKASLDDDKNDYYALGMYDQHKNVWIPDNPQLDVGIGMRYDYGKFYASKTFYDQNKERRILWGWIGETDSERADINKGWASLMAVPREITFDKKTKSNIIQWPVEETESLRLNSKTFKNVELGAGSIVPLDFSSASQIDITADFEINGKALEGLREADVGYNCSTSGGSAARGVLGPFGLLVLADESRSEQTAVYFYIAKGTNGKANTFFCTDGSRSSKATDVGKHIYGSSVPVLHGEKLSVRILVDHSIVEAFAQGGRTVITSRVYPTQAIYGSARVFLFNNATGTSVTISSIQIWQMSSAFNHQFPSHPKVWAWFVVGGILLLSLLAAFLCC